MAEEKRRTYIDVPYRTRLGRHLEWRVQNPKSKKQAHDIACQEIQSFGPGNKVIAKAKQLKFEKHPIFRPRVLRPS